MHSLIIKWKLKSIMNFSIDLLSHFYSWLKLWIEDLETLLSKALLTSSRSFEILENRRAADVFSLLLKKKPVGHRPNLIRYRLSQHKLLPWGCIQESVGRGVRKAIYPIWLCLLYFLMGRFLYYSFSTFPGIHWCRDSDTQIISP